MTETLHRAFKPPMPPTPAALQVVTNALLQMVQQFIAAIEAHTSSTPVESA